MITPFFLALTLIAPTDSVVKRGAPVPTRAAISAVEVRAAPDRFGADTIVIEGLIEKVCQEMGCWLQLTGTPGTSGVRIVTHAQNFFVPFSAAGMRVRAVGVVKVRELTKEQADHLTEEGITLKRNADGSAVEIQFAATGVELRPAT